MNINREKLIREKYSKLTHKLIELNKTITTMESATSGQIASLITDTEGSSAIFKGAFITYSNEAKTLSGVSEEIIQKYGVYSKETAAAMAEACRKFYDADFGIGITGTFSNVDPMNNDSIPGTVYFAIALKERTDAYKYDLKCLNSRHESKFEVAEIFVNKMNIYL